MCLGVNTDYLMLLFVTGDVSETIRVYFEKSKAIRPANKSTMAMNDVDEFLNKLSKLSKEEEQIEHFQKIVERCTSNDLKMVCYYGLFSFCASYKNIIYFLRSFASLSTTFELMLVRRIFWLL